MNMYGKNIILNSIKGVTVLLCVALGTMLNVWAGGDNPTQFTNQDSILNTRHNLSQSTMQNGQAAQMNAFRNDYGGVCVYCHTPHGASTSIDAPLWNRTFVNNTYTTYDTLNSSSISSAITQPGVNSLTCLSCHDGTVAIDSIINMPGSGQYDVARQTTSSDALLDAFQPAAGQTRAGDHQSLNAGTSFADQSCLVCHNPAGPGDASDFTVFVIGTDLTNDHPVGINLPISKLGDDFNDPETSRGNIRFYDADSDSRPDPNEVRFYDTGDGPEVECTSCHDPHGVPLSVGASQFTPSFLRVVNTGSDLCQTCHNK